MANENSVKSLSERRETILKEMLELFPMVPGAFKEVFRKCGKPTCWCANQVRGHSLRRITWSENGQAQSKAVSDNELDWFIIATENYRKFQQLKKQMAEYDAIIADRLNEYAKGQVVKSRMEREIAVKDTKR
jgi:hypothetical protein